MKICVAQIRPAKGAIEQNIDKHVRLINLAASNKADLIIFPELSLTGYEPELANDLATSQDDHRFDVFQTISDAKQITIGVGMPTKHASGIQISMILFQPGQARQTYSKQHLHEDETPYFVNGKEPLFLRVCGNKIAPAICYELSVPEHSENAFKNGAGIYMASVAKTSNGVVKAITNLSDIAKRHSMTVFMANCVGPSGDGECAGKTSILNQQGELAGQLNETAEGLLIMDTDTQNVTATYGEAF